MKCKLQAFNQSSATLSKRYCKLCIRDFPTQAALKRGTGHYGGGRYGGGRYGGGRYGGGRYGGNLPKGGHYGGSILPYNQYIFICT